MVELAERTACWREMTGLSIYALCGAAINSFLVTLLEARPIEKVEFKRRSNWRVSYVSYRITSRRTTRKTGWSVSREACMKGDAMECSLDVIGIVVCRGERPGSWESREQLQGRVE